MAEEFASLGGRIESSVLKFNPPLKDLKELSMMVDQLEKIAQGVAVEQ